MRKAWCKNLQLLVLIFLFFAIFSISLSFKSLSAETGESASLQIALTLAPAEAVVPGDRITRQILLENLTDKKLKYSVEEIRCTGTAALLPYLTLQLSSEEETLIFGRIDRLGTMSSFPVSIPEADLKLILDFSSEAEASLMGSKAQIELLLSAAEVIDGEIDVPETTVPETKTAEAVSRPEEAEEIGKADSGTMAETEGNARQEESAAERGKESAAGSADEKSSSGVLFGGAISFLGGPGTDLAIEVPEDPPLSVENPQQAENQKQDAAEQKTEVNTDMDSRLIALLDRLRKKQKDRVEASEENLTAAGKRQTSDRSGLSVWVEELGGRDLRIQKTQSIHGGEAVTIYLGEANMKGSARRIFNALGNFLLWFMVFLAIYFALSAYQERRTGKPFFFMGYKPVLILSESMEPTYPKGAIVLVRKQKRAAEPGDVVMFSPEEGSGTYVIHRIVGESGEGFITRGDHNNTEDRGIVAPEQIYGTVKGLLWC